jgi:hypothetical protein
VPEASHIIISDVPPIFPEMNGNAIATSAEDFMGKCDRVRMSSAPSIP